MKIRQILFGAAAATFGIVALAAPAAAASSEVTPKALPQHKCKTGAPNDSRWCLYIEKPNATERRYNVRATIDVKMSRADAQAIIDAPGDPFTAAMWGDDPSNNDYLFGVPLVTLSASDASGLSATFTANVRGESLDEDDSIGDRGDEVWAKIIFRDPRSGQPRTFDTPNINDRF